MCILRYTPSSAAVGVDDRGGIAIDPGRLPLEDRHDEDHRQLARQRAACASVVGPGNRLRQVEAVALLRLAEVRRVEQLLQADDLRAAARAASRTSRSARAHVRRASAVA